MDLTMGDMLIMSGEGTGSGMIERYVGKRDAASIRRRLSRERAGGNRWADAWIELEGIKDKDGLGERVYGKLGRGLDEIVDQREIPASSIRDNPAAMLRAGKASPHSAANGARGGRPREITYSIQWGPYLPGDCDTLRATTDKSARSEAKAYAKDHDLREYVITFVRRSDGCHGSIDI